MNKSGFYSLLICFFISLLFSCNTESDSQNTTPPSANSAVETENTLPKKTSKSTLSVEEKIKTIRNLYKGIQDNLSNYTTRSKPYTGNSEVPIAGELTGYLAENEVIKLVDQSEEDHGPSKNEFYFVDGKLFFLFSQVSTVEMTEKPNIHVRELRLYFDEDKIIDALVKTKTFKDGEKIDMSIIANKKNDSLINSQKESEYYSQRASKTLEFFNSKESFDEFYGEE